MDVRRLLDLKSVSLKGRSNLEEEYEKEVDIVFNTFEKIESTNSKYEKLKYLKQIKDLNVFKKIVKIVFSDSIKTYISYKTILKLGCGNVQKSTFLQFLSLVGKLSKREIVGNEAIDQVKEFLQNCDYFHCKWYGRILSKSLRIGIDVNMLRELYSSEEMENKLMIKKIAPMLAYNVRTLKSDVVNKLLQENDWIYEEKIDGLRCLCIIHDMNIYCFSRNWRRLPGAEKYIMNAFNNNALKKMNGMVLDGEFYSKDWSSTITSVFKQKNSNLNIKNVTYNVFDYIPYDKLKSGKYNLPLIKRKELLKKDLVRLGVKHPIRIVPHAELKDKSLSNLYNLSEKFLKNGFEGIIIKVKDSPYVCKRSKYWLKIKEIKTIDVLCVDVEISYKRKNKISALIFELNGKKCKVGAGLTDEDRKLFYNRPELVVGKIIELKYQEISQNGCLRFPVFIRVRYDKDIPDA